MKTLVSKYNTKPDQMGNFFPFQQIFDLIEKFFPQVFLPKLLLIQISIQELKPHLHGMIFFIKTVLD